MAPQNTFFVGSWLFRVTGNAVLVMADRIGKRGVLSESITIFGVLYTFTGGLRAPVAIVGAVIGEATGL